LKTVGIYTMMKFELYCLLSNYDKLIADLVYYSRNIDLYHNLSLVSHGWNIQWRINKGRY